jgi:hypothetical protein
MITVAIGNFRQRVGMIRIEERDQRIEEKGQLELIYYLVPAFAVVIIFVAIVLMVVCWYHHRKVRVLKGELGWANVINQVELSKLQRES